tara:strand:+ start:52 stop:279 length:228 start_codon:yes stop_codon:yes gene_type:complete
LPPSYIFNGKELNIPHGQLTKGETYKKGRKLSQLEQQAKDEQNKNWKFDMKHVLEAAKSSGNQVEGQAQPIILSH